MCFGERTTFVCFNDGCTNKHWETKYYVSGADSDSGKCDAGNVLGTCTDPWMVYHQEETMCRGCSTRWTEESSSPPPTPETWHPQDHNHSLPTLPTYEQFELATLKTGELTGPMIVTRELNRQPRDGHSIVTQQNVPEHQLLGKIRDLIRRRYADDLALEGSGNTTNAADSTEVTTDADDVLPPLPITLISALSRSEISAAVFEGPLPEALINDTPLPTYDQVASRGHAPSYSVWDLGDIPVNLRTLKRLSDYNHYLRKALSSDLQDQIVNIVDAAYTAMTMPDRCSVAKMQKVADAARYLEEGLVRLYNKANDRQNIISQYSITSATEHPVAEWIAEITRNPENSVRSHARRLTEWICRLEYEFVLDFRQDNPLDGIKLPDGSRYPDCEQINRIFEQEEVRDQRDMQGENWDESSGTLVRASDTDKLLIADVKRRDKGLPSSYRPNYHYGDQDKPSWRDESRGPVHADTRRRIRIPTAFGVLDRYLVLMIRWKSSSLRLINRE